mmetsp:Transcript_23678/g.55229  ORF Transcript_23678/g.55229 Transcript_23678/m.55229 type:complete len:270 (+) Transcript_23678:579-1388(+)
MGRSQRCLGLQSPSGGCRNRRLGQGGARHRCQGRRPCSCPRTGASCWSCPDSAAPLAPSSRRGPPHDPRRACHRRGSRTVPPAWPPAAAWQSPRRLSRAPRESPPPPWRGPPPLPPRVGRAQRSRALRARPSRGPPSRAAPAQASEPLRWRTPSSPLPLAAWPSASPPSLCAAQPPSSPAPPSQLSPQPAAPHQPRVPPPSPWPKSGHASRRPVRARQHLGRASAAPFASLVPLPLPFFSPSRPLGRWFPQLEARMASLRMEDCLAAHP